MHFSIGDIAYSGFWLEFTSNSYDSGRAFGLGKTYNGTITGVVWIRNTWKLIAHSRWKGESLKSIPSHLTKTRIHIRIRDKEFHWKAKSKRKDGFYRWAKHYVG